jgi:hypothetical protein
MVISTTNGDEKIYSTDSPVFDSRGRAKLQRADPGHGDPHKAATMTAWIVRQRLGPAKRPLYPQVIAYPT